MEPAKIQCRILYNSKIQKNEGGFIQQQIRTSNLLKTEGSNHPNFLRAEGEERDGRFYFVQTCRLPDNCPKANSNKGKIWVSIYHSNTQKWTSGGVEFGTKGRGGGGLISLPPQKRFPTSKTLTCFW